jgi:hypothetical protein
LRAHGRGPGIEPLGRPLPVSATDLGKPPFPVEASLKQIVERQVGFLASPLAIRRSALGVPRGSSVHPCSSGGTLAQELLLQHANRLFSRLNLQMIGQEVNRWLTGAAF